MMRLSGTVRVGRVSLLILVSALLMAAVAFAAQVRPAEALTQTVAQEARAWMNTFDRNGDGKINLNSTKETYFQGQCYCQLLHAADANHNSSVVYKEMKGFWTKRDLNGDGKINDREFDKTMRLYPAF